MNDSSENNTIKCAIISSKLVRWIYAGNIFWKVKKKSGNTELFLKKKELFIKDYEEQVFKTGLYCPLHHLIQALNKKKQNKRMWKVW